MSRDGSFSSRDFTSVEILTKIMGIFSTDLGSIAGFTAIMALVSHGIQRIWGMATALFRQIEGLVTGVISGIEQINGMAGGSAAGFNQSAASVDFMFMKARCPKASSAPCARFPVRSSSS